MRISDPSFSASVFPSSGSSPCDCLLPKGVKSRTSHPGVIQLLFLLIHPALKYLLAQLHPVPTASISSSLCRLQVASSLYFFHPFSTSHPPLIYSPSLSHSFHCHLPFIPSRPLLLALFPLSYTVPIPFPIITVFSFSSVKIQFPPSIVFFFAQLTVSLSHLFPPTSISF